MLIYIKNNKENSSKTKSSLTLPQVVKHNCHIQYYLRKFTVTSNEYNHRSHLNGPIPLSQYS